jgi:hypothetical protein
MGIIRLPALQSADNNRIVLYRNAFVGGHIRKSLHQLTLDNRPSNAYIGNVLGRSIEKEKRNPKSINSGYISPFLTGGYLCNR